MIYSLFPQSWILWMYCIKCCVTVIPRLSPTVSQPWVRSWPAREAWSSTQRLHTTYWTGQIHSITCRMQGCTCTSPSPCINHCSSLCAIYLPWFAKCHYHWKTETVIFTCTCTCTVSHIHVLWADCSVHLYLLFLGWRISVSGVSVRCLIFSGATNRPLRMTSLIYWYVLIL